MNKKKSKTPKLITNIKGDDIMDKKKRKAIIDDGMNPELVKGADFDGYLGIPMIKKPEQFIIHSDIVTFTKRKRTKCSDIAIGFY